ncbi:tetraspanin [Plakobranchus ocellatus]|uniref:Tetraspanin n=1 Tax=Plakobranchus ocellatus TaxID=259542 RepID=A0AAV4C2C1_9GAST|nr:tetraspanin [Plakobranchus ocellatus]
MGLTLFIIGCLIRFGSDTIEEFFADRISGTWNFMRSAGSEGNMENFDLSHYIATGAYTLIGLGVFFLFVSFFGCCGGIGKIRCFLIFYAMCVVLLILLELAVVILLVGFPQKVRAVMKEPLLRSLQEDYVGIQSSDPASAGWNFLMVVVSTLCMHRMMSGEFTLGVALYTLTRKLKFKSFLSSVFYSEF